jgi:hypothetical protein
MSESVSDFVDVYVCDVYDVDFFAHLTIKFSILNSHHLLVFVRIENQRAVEHEGFCCTAAAKVDTVSASEKDIVGCLSVFFSFFSSTLHNLIVASCTRTRH